MANKVQISKINHGTRTISFEDMSELATGFRGVHNQKKFAFTSFSGTLTIVHTKADTSESGYIAGKGFDKETGKQINITFAACLLPKSKRLIAAGDWLIPHISAVA